MLIRFKKAGKQPGFQSAALKESSDKLQNPGCGWYHVYTFQAQPPGDGRPVEEEAWMDESCQEEQLALALIDIGAFRVSPLSEEALAHVRLILDFSIKTASSCCCGSPMTSRGRAWRGSR